jgi:DNA modification methylase
MKPYLTDADVTLYLGDALDVLRELPDESVHCCVTSPPFYGLRDYGTGRWEGGDDECDHAANAPVSNQVDPRHQAKPGWDSTSGKTKETTNRAERVPGRVCVCGARRIDQQIGLEETPEQWVNKLVAVFREVRRVLRSDGTCWVELGDSYATSQFTRQGKPRNVPQAANGYAGEEWTTDRSEAYSAHGWDVSGLKPKDLCGTPWLLAFALRADGWYLRSEIIWSKPNPMPESVTDRPTTAHSRIFLLAKSPRYFFDAEAVREPTVYTPDQIRKQALAHKKRAAAGRIRGNNDGTADFGVMVGEPHGAESGRNVRSVWEIATEPFPEAHFATFPQALVRRCILAGTSERGCCPECGAPWVREVEREYLPSKKGGPQHSRGDARRDPATRTDLPAERLDLVMTTTGWRPSCECRYTAAIIRHPNRDEVRQEPLRPVPCTVLDPFIGSGTTAYVARKLGRRAIGIDLNEEYLEMAARRLAQQSLFAQEAV